MYRLLYSSLALCVLLAGCSKPKPQPTPPAPTVQTVITTSGIVDWSGWKRWIRETPRMVLVDNIDTETQRLISEQTRLFKVLVSEPEAVPVGTNLNKELETLKTAFLNRAYNKHNFYYNGGNNVTSTDTTTYYSSSSAVRINVPHFDCWDRYRRMVQGLQVSNLETTIFTLERQSGYDQKDLAEQKGSNGIIGAQARADLNWQASTLTPFIESLKRLSTPKVPATTDVARARNQWQGFETNQLPLIQRVMTDRTIAVTTANDDGSFSMIGKGQLYAIVTVAGRELYFPANGRDAPGLLFVNIHTKSVPSAP